MTTMPDDTAVAIANAEAHARACEARLMAAQHERDAAHRERDAYGYDPVGVTARVRLVILEKEARLEEAEARLSECQRVFHAAREQWVTLVAAARRVRHDPRLQRARTGAQAVVALLEEDQHDQDTVLATLGLAQGQGEHPVGVARHVLTVLDTHLRRLHPPPPPSPLPPARAGFVRIRVLKPFWDHDKAYGLRQEPGTIYDMRADLAREALEQQLVEAVEAGG